MPKETFGAEQAAEAVGAYAMDQANIVKLGLDPDSAADMKIAARIAFADKMFQTFLDETLGPAGEEREPDAEYGEKPFEKRRKDEQEDLLFRLYSLVDERKSVTRSLLEEKDEKPEQQYSIRVLKGRSLVRTPRAVTKEEAKKNTQRIASIEASEKRKEAIKEELARLGAIPGFREAYNRKILKTYLERTSSQKLMGLKIRNAEIEARIDTLRADAASGRTGAVSAGVLGQEITLLEAERKENNETIADAESQKEHGAIARLDELSAFKEAYDANRLIEVPSVRETIDEGLNHMRNHQPFLLAGHLGSGKTEVAKEMARRFMLENLDTIEDLNFTDEEYADPDALMEKLTPEVFSGGDEASVYDLIGKLKLEAKEGATQTIFGYGPFGRAIKRGVPIIIDEINMIPPEVISRINDALLRGIGSMVRLQENGEEELEIKPGFAVLATCNLGVQYAGVKEVNAAFKSRWVAKEVGYPEVEETFDMILAALLRKDRPRLPSNFPSGSFERLPDLAITVRELQELFSGETEGQRFMALSSGTRAEKSQLEQSVVSPRDVMRKIVDPWRKGDFSESLETIIARNILKAEVFSKFDQKFMTEIFLRRGFFADWKATDFKKVGIRSITQKELNALQAAQQTDEYKEANKSTDALRSSVRDRVSLIQRMLHIGVDEDRSEK